MMGILKPASRLHIGAVALRRGAQIGVALFVLAALDCVVASSQAQAEAQSQTQTRARHKAAPRKAPAMSPATQEARHAKCMAFIKGHGLECDPWDQPTCGYDLGIMRPLECARPF